MGAVPVLSGSAFCQPDAGKRHQSKRDPREAEPLFPLGDLSGCLVLPDSFWRVWLEL